MTRGKGVATGSERTNKNGYVYVKVEKDGKFIWVSKHYIIAEQMLGRPLAKDERVAFIGSRRNLDPSNIRVLKKGGSTLKRQLLKVNEQMAILELKQRALEEKISQEESKGSIDSQ